MPCNSDHMNPTPLERNPMPKPLPHILTQTQLNQYRRARFAARTSDTIHIAAHERAKTLGFHPAVRLLARLHDLEISIHRLCSQVDRSTSSGYPLTAADRSAIRRAISLLQDTFGV